VESSRAGRRGTTWRAAEGYIGGGSLKGGLERGEVTLFETASMGNVILMLSLIVAAVIVYLAVNHWIPVQFGASLHAK